MPSKADLFVSRSLSFDPDGGVDCVQWDLGFKVVTAACCMETWCVVMALTDVYTDQVFPAL